MAVSINGVFWIILVPIFPFMHNCKVIYDNHFVFQLTIKHDDIDRFEANNTSIEILLSYHIICYHFGWLKVKFSDWLGYR